MSHHRPGAVPRDYPDQQSGSTTQPDLWDEQEREDAALNPPDDEGRPPSDHPAQPEPDEPSD